MLLSKTKNYYGPFVDIVIPNYNRRAFLQRAVQSVLNQSYKNWNLFIVDDGSSEALVNDFLSWIKRQGAGYVNEPYSKKISQRQGRTSLLRAGNLKEFYSETTRQEENSLSGAGYVNEPCSKKISQRQGEASRSRVENLNESYFKTTREEGNPLSGAGYFNESYSETISVRQDGTSLLRAGKNLNKPYSEIIGTRQTGSSQRKAKNNKPCSKIKLIQLKPSHPSKNQIQILRWESNKGVSYARNQGLKQGQADWIAFLDSDDEWLPHKLEKQMEYAKKNPQCSFIHCNELWFKNGKAFNQKKKHKKQGGRIFIPSVRLCCVSPSAVLIKRNLFKKLGLFREDFPVCEDYELWLRITSRYNVGFLDESLLIKHGGHKDQLSKKYVAMDFWRVKALSPYLEDKNLSAEERREVKQTLTKKLKILLKGCPKHKNFKIQKEMEKIYARLV